MIVKDLESYVEDCGCTGKARGGLSRVFSVARGHEQLTCFVGVSVLDRTLLDRLACGTAGTTLLAQAAREITAEIGTVVIYILADWTPGNAVSDLSGDLLYALLLAQSGAFFKARRLNADAPKPPILLLTGPEAAAVLRRCVTSIGSAGFATLDPSRHSWNLTRTVRLVLEFDVPLESRLDTVDEILQCCRTADETRFVCSEALGGSMGVSDRDILSAGGKLAQRLVRLAALYYGNVTETEDPGALVAVCSLIGRVFCRVLPLLSFPPLDDADVTSLVALMHMQKVQAGVLLETADTAGRRRLEGSLASPSQLLSILETHYHAAIAEDSK